MNKYILLLWAFAACIRYGYAQPSGYAPAQADSIAPYLYKNGYALLGDYIGRLRYEDSIEIYRRVAVLDDLAKKSGDSKYLLYAESVHLAVDQIMNRYYGLPEKLHALIRKAEEQHFIPVVVYAYYTLGNLYYDKNVRNYPLAFSYYLRGYNIYHNLPSGPLILKTYNQYQLARSYYDFFDLENALKYSKEIEDRLPDYEPENYMVHLFNNVLVGMCYQKLGKYDSSRIYFDRLYGIASQKITGSLSQIWIGLALGNSGASYYLQGEYDKAVPLLEKSVPACLSNNEWSNAASFSFDLAAIALKQNNLEKAKEHLQTGRHAAYKANNVKNYERLYRLLSDYERKTGNIAMALQHLDSFIIYKDSLDAKDKVTAKYKAEMAVEKERHTLNEQLIEKDKQKQLLLRNALIGLVTTGLIITLLVYSRQRLKSQYREKQLEAEMQTAQQELLNATRQLDDFASSFREKNELIEKAGIEIERTQAELQKLKHLSPLVDNATDADPLSLLQLKESILLTNEDWQHFTELFEKVHAGFFARLRLKLPGLSPAEIRFMALCKLKYSGKDMAAMLGIGTDAIRQYRSRLKKKLSLPEETSFEDLAASV